MIRQSEARVSIIMRSKNSDWVIDRALAALISQTFTDFELTVVDSGSTDRTLEIVRNYPCRLIQIEAKSYFPGAVLNSAIENTSGELIVFQNSDAVPLCQLAILNHFADGLMPQNNREMWRWGATLDFIQFGVANPASGHFDQDLFFCRYRLRQILQCQWLAFFFEVA